MAYLTIYPHKGYEAVTDAELNELGERLLRIIQAGRKIFLRLWPEMNGTWFPYGQNPAAFKRAWRRAVEIILRIIGEENRDQLALVWAPNSGNGYPWLNGMASPRSASDPRIPDLDTNGDGILDNRDNPYTPFYPGDDVVDWVGISVYHYGFQWPWIQNVIPTPNKFEGIMEAFPNTEEDWSRFPFYTPSAVTPAESPVSRLATNPSCCRRWCRLPLRL
ncbi:glycoside hydrolase superfamily [Chytridium lagenaria]|nr:glycoside hydrolase superfamily [Chytridium lagenaria]